MNMHTRNEYLKTLKPRYLKASKQEKTKILDEYCTNTGQHRKYAIRKLQARHSMAPRQRKARAVVYDRRVAAVLVNIWEILDYPCGQRLQPQMADLTGKLIAFGELEISEDVRTKLLSISSATIDRLLRHEKVVRHRKRFSTTKPGSLLKARIPIRLTEWDTSQVGYVEMDLVAHCGDNVFGDYVNTLDVVEISSGWSEQAAVMGKAQERTFAAIKDIRARSPFAWKGLDSDNGSEFINMQLWRYCIKENLEFTRSRPNKKNDNAYVEQKNWTHVRKLVGYLRYDTEEELAILNDIYRNELRLYKNFFCPVMKLVKKERVGSRIVKRYDTPQTPYQRLTASAEISPQTKRELRALYDTLNPAELKRRIDTKLNALYQAYKTKPRGMVVPKFSNPASVTFSVMQR